MADNSLLVERVERSYGTFLGLLLVGAMAAVALMSVSTTFDVLKRWITGWPIGGVMQLNECLMVVLVFLGIAHAQRSRNHIRISFILARLNRRTVVWADILACCIAIACLTMMGIMTTVEAIYSFSILEYRVGDVRLPIYWARALIPLGCFAFVGQLFLDIWANVERLKGRLPMELSDVRLLNDQQ